MKKVVAVLLAVVMLMGLCACGGGSKKEASVTDKVRRSVESHVSSYVSFRYGRYPHVNITSLTQVGENEYEAAGKVSVKDEYGDSYTGKFDAEATYNPEQDKCNVQVDVGTLYED